jgi:uncharacterized protein YjbJ (UPF0337 family)
MNWDQIEINWKQFKPIAKQEWSKLTDDQLETIAGKRDQLVKRLQEVYGTTREATNLRVSAWLGQQAHATILPMDGVVAVGKKPGASLAKPQHDQPVNKGTHPRQ